jgi:hypothetical protein
MGGLCRFGDWMLATLAMSCSSDITERVSGGLSLTLNMASTVCSESRERLLET